MFKYSIYCVCGKCAYIGFYVRVFERFFIQLSIVLNCDFVQNIRSRFYTQTIAYYAVHMETKLNWKFSTLIVFFEKFLIGFLRSSPTR